MTRETDSRSQALGMTCARKSRWGEPGSKRYHRIRLTVNHTIRAIREAREAQGEPSGRSRP